MAMRVRWLVWSAALVAGIGLGVGIAIARQDPESGPQEIPAAQQIPNPRLDRGVALNAVAPAFTLTDEFGKKVSLSSFRGKVVVVSFNDPKCTTICPLATTALLEAKKKLGPAAADVELLGISANPEATEVKWVRDYSRTHKMLHKWRFLTGSLPELKRVWQAYGISVQVVAGDVVHTAGTYVIDPQGRERRLFLTQPSYSAVPQLAEVLARGIAAVLPSHPRVRNPVSLAPIPLIGPRERIALSGTMGSTTWLGPGHGPHLVLFFNTWDPRVAVNLRRLNRYAALNSVAPLVALDEGGLEEPGALRTLMDTVKPAYPVFDDHDGRIADGYGVEDSPWLTLVSGSGKILWSYNIAEEGWPSTKRLVNRVHAALAR
jgi:cytochrome oxidase Cu insertion factor (SCO1/SenC/PrrC family)